MRAEPEDYCGGQSVKVYCRGGRDKRSGWQDRISWVLDPSWAAHTIGGDLGLYWFADQSKRFFEAYFGGGTPWEKSAEVSASL